MALTPRVFDTAILHKSLSSRAVTPNNANGVNNNFKIDRDGQMVAAPMYNFESCIVKISNDNGYTWTKRGDYYITPRTSTIAEGPNYEVFYDKETNFVAVLHVGYGYIQIARDRPGEELDDTSPYARSQIKYSSTYLDKPSGNFMVFDGNVQMVYGAYINTSTGRLIMAGYDTTSAIEHCLQDYSVYNITSPVLGNIAIKAYEDKVHTLAQSGNSIVYIPFTKKIGNGNGSFGTEVSIAAGSNFRDLSIDINASGTLAVIYSTDSGTTASGFYSVSTDNGTSWDIIGLIPPSGYSSVLDPLTSKYSNRSSIIAGYDDSFLVSNCYTNNSTGDIDLFVKEVFTTDSGVILTDIPTQSGVISIGYNGYMGIYENSAITPIDPIVDTKLNDITYGNSTFIAVGNSGVILKSGDGRNWSEVDSGITKNLYAVSYNVSGAFCAVGASGAILTSTDGTTWTERNYIANTIDLKGITTFNPTQYWVVVGNDSGSTTSRLYTSTTLDGTSWTSRTIGYNEVWNDITSSSTLLVIVGNNGKLYTSGDGITWTNRDSGTSEHLNSVAHSTARFVAAGNNGAVTISSTGTTWYLQTPAPTSVNLHSTVAVGSGMYIGGSGYIANSAGGLIPYSTCYSGDEDITGLGYGTVSGIYYGYGSTPVSTTPWRKVNSANGNIIGAKFFKYTDEVIPNFGDKSTIHMAYQLGKQNSKDGQDSVASTIFQEKLSNNAYQEEYEGDAFTQNLFDYYASGYINEKTKLYMSDFDKIGTEVSISKYEPIEKSLIDGKGGFQTPVTWSVVALIDPGSSTAPTVARGNAEFEEYIGRDSRKIFFKADCYLDRNYIINNGGYKKKTVYTIRLEDKDYEVEQILPRFLNNCIMYWEANLFVVSPTNDPFKG